MTDVLTFSPAEAAFISGVSADLQRDWRRRGFLPSASGRARFTVEDAARLYIMNACSALAPIAAAGPLADVLAPTLGAYATDDGPEPIATAAVMADGQFATFPTMQAAVDALEAEGVPTLRMLPLEFIATPFKVRVRSALERRGAAE